MQIAASNTETIAKFNALCNGCNAFADDEKRRANCPTCNIETMRNACILDAQRTMMEGGGADA